MNQMQNAKIVKKENELFLKIPKQLIQQYQLDEGDQFSFEGLHNKITFSKNTPKKDLPKHIHLQDLDLDQLFDSCWIFELNPRDLSIAFLAILTFQFFFSPYLSKL